jgi:putative DNA primase/helicase
LLLSGFVSKGLRMAQIDKKEAILNHFAGDWTSFYAALVSLPEAGSNGSVKIQSPIRDDDDNPSFVIDLKGERAGRWHDFGTGKSGDGFDLYQRLRGISAFPEVLAAIDSEFVDSRTPQSNASKSPKISGIKPTQAEARAEAIRMWESAGPASEDHPYLKKKGIKAFGVRERDGDLLVPVTDGGELHSLQLIKPNGWKQFLAGGRTRGCYFPIGTPDDVLYVAEGYATAATIHEVTGFSTAAAFSSGQLLTVATTLRAKYPDIRIVVCADNDEDKDKNPGLTSARKAAEAVEGFLAVPDFGKDRPRGESDFNDLNRRAGPEAVRRCIDAAGHAIEEWPEPQPLPNTMPDVEPFDLQLLPKAFAPWVEDVSDRMQAPSDYAAVGLMVALGAVVGRQIAIRPKAADDWTVVPNLWGGIVGRPGVMKTPALQEALRPLQKLEAAAQEEHRIAQIDFEADKFVCEARIKNAKAEIQKALKRNEDVNEFAKTVLNASEAEPTRARYLVHDATVEKLGEILADNPRGVLVFRDELTGWLRNLDRQGREGDRAFFLESWNGTGRFSYDRIGRGSLDIEAACVSVLGGIQPGPLSGYMSKAASGGGDDDGLVQRFQMLVWPDISGMWVNVDRTPDPDAREEAYAAFERLDCIDTSTIGAQNPEDGGLPFLRFSGVAQEAFTEWRTELEHGLRRDDLPPIVEAHLSKYRSLVPSLALLIFLADKKTGPVDEESLLKACGWAEYLETHARRVYAPVLVPSVAAAVPLAEHIKQDDLGTVFSVAQVQQKDWSSLTENTVIVDALDLLADMDWLRIMEDRKTGGRPKIRYLVNPAVKGM